MNDLGIRGIRFNLVQAGATTIEMIEPLSKRVNDLGWHIQIHMKGEQLRPPTRPIAAIFRRAARSAQFQRSTS